MSFVGGRELVDGASMFGLNIALGVTYCLLVVWGVFSAIMPLLYPDETGWQVQTVAFVVVSTIAHYTVSFGGATAVQGSVSYPVRPALFRLIDVLVLVASATLIVFFLSPSTLFPVALGGSVATTLLMSAQVYKVGTIVQGIASGARDEATGKLLSDGEY